MIYAQNLMLFLLSAHFTLGMIVISFAGVFFIIFATSPVELGPLGMLLAFAIFYLWFLALCLGIVHVGRAFVNKRTVEERQHRTLSSRSAILAVGWAFAPLILLALQSIGQLYITSVGLVLLFELLATIYILRR